MFDHALKGPQVTPETVAKISMILNEQRPIPYHLDVVGYEHLKHGGLQTHIDEVGEPLPLNPK